MASLFSVILTPLGTTLIIVALALMMLEIELCILSIRQRRTFDTINLIWGIFLFTCLMDVIAEYDVAETGEVNWLIGTFMRLPWIAIVGMELLTIIVVVIRARVIYKYRKTRITRSSIKEAMDKLPAGIMILVHGESMALSNLRMNKYAKKLTGKRLSDGKEFWDFVTTNGEMKGDRYILRTADGMYISFKKDQILILDKCYDEIKAFDVTDQARVLKELEEKNARLRDVQYRMKAYQARAADMFMDQELLDARVAVHDGLGALLLQSRSYLEGNMDDEEEFLKSLKYTNGFLLSESEAIDEERDHYQDGLRMAEGVGVNVSIEGEKLLDRRGAGFDADKITQIRNILGQAIGECAANTIKHAGGDEVKVLIQRQDSTMILELTNNGEPPKDDIKETGGLLSLRHMVDNMNGEMYIESEPEFRLKIILKDDVQGGDE